VDLRTDRHLRAVRARALNKYAPGTIVRAVRWTGGETEVLELGDGPSIVLVHGGLGQAIDWAPIMAQLSLEFHVYAVDRPGHGLAGSFDYRGVPMLPHSVTFLSEILTALGLDRVVLVGNSMGGRWAIEYALRKPDAVSHVVLPGLPAGAARELPRGFYEVRRLLRLMQRPFIGRVVRHLMATPSSRKRAREGMRALVSDPERVSDELVDSGTFNFLRNRRSMLTLIEQATDERGMLPEFVLQDRWRHLQVPTTFLWGDNDLFGPPELGREAASHVPDGRFVLIRDAGHLPWLDQPDRVAMEIKRAASPG
jgi:pimeloyl-ACP methyl ester carboxylesterase